MNKVQVISAVACVCIYIRSTYRLYDTSLFSCGVALVKYNLQITTINRTCSLIRSLTQFLSDSNYTKCFSNQGYR